MTSDQSKSFGGFLGAGRKKSDKLKLLFDRMKRIDPQDSKADRLIRGKEFKSSDQYYRSRERLLDKLVRCFAQQRENSANPIVYIEKAVSFSALDLAEKTWILEVKRHLQNEDFLGLLKLYNLRDDLMYQYKPVFAEVDMSKYPTRTELLEKIEGEATIRRAVDRLRGALKLDQKSRQLTVLTCKPVVESFVVRGKTSQLMWLKARFILEMLRSSYVDAWSVQSEVVAFLSRETAFFSSAIRIREYSNFVRISMAVGNRNSATEYAFRLSGEPVASTGEERLRILHATRDSILVAEKYANLHLLEGALDIFRANQGLFEESEQALLCYWIALTYLYNAHYRDAVKWINQIFALSPGARGKLGWQPNVLLLILHFELGNVDVLESLLPACQREVGAQETLYPRILVQAVHALFRARPDHSPQEVLSPFLAELDLLVGDPDEARSELFFHFRQWIRARLQGVSMADLILDEGENGNSQGLVQVMG